MRSYTWDALDRLASVTKADGLERLEFNYDGQNRRTERRWYERQSSGDAWTLAETRRYAWDGDRVIAEFDGNNTLLTSYVWGIGGLAGGLLAVTAINRAPRVESGPGRVVLTTVNHLNQFVFNLTLRNAVGEAETLGVTGFHKFYDQAEGWQSVRDLTVGDTLRGRNGETVTVVNVTRDLGVRRVYNMTVEADHVYFVGDLTTLTHNNCPSEILGKNLMGGNAKAAQMMRDLGFDAHHIVSWKLDAADNLQKFMFANGFSLDDLKYSSWNGAWLPGSKRANGILGNKPFYNSTTWHKGAPAFASKHSQATMDAILGRLRTFNGDPAGIIDEVKRIGLEMQNGIFRN